jgi:hypothetical protein
MKVFRSALISTDDYACASPSDTPRAPARRDDRAAARLSVLRAQLILLCQEEQTHAGDSSAAADHAALLTAVLSFWGALSNLAQKR